MNFICEWTLSALWLLFAVFANYLNYLVRVVLAYHFWALATIAVCFSVLCSLGSVFVPYVECISAKFIQGVPLATEPGNKILQRNLNRDTFVVWEMKRNVSVVCVCSAPNCCNTEQQSASNILINGKIIKEMPGSVARGTHCMFECSYFLVSLVISCSWLHS